MVSLPFVGHVIYVSVKSGAVFLYFSYVLLQTPEERLAGFVRIVLQAVTQS